MTAEPAEPVRLPVAEPLDLAAIVDRHPIRVVRLDMAAVLLGLSTGDMDDIEAALGVPFAEITTAPRLAVLAVLAWLIGRREDPDLTLDHVRTQWRVEVHEDPTLPRPSKPRRSGRSESRG